MDNLFIKSKDFEPVKWNPEYTDCEVQTNTNVGKLTDSGELDKSVDQKEKWVKMTLFTAFNNFPNAPIRKVKPKKVTANVSALLKHYNCTLKYNVIRDSVDMFLNGKKLQNFDINLRMIADFAVNHNFDMPKSILIDFCYYVSNQNRYNPIEIFLKTRFNLYFQQDNTKLNLKLAKNEFKKLAGTLKTEYDTKIVQKWLMKFLLQAVELACSPDESTIAGQFVFVLQGGQNSGKTTWLKNLVPKELQMNYFLEGRSLDPSNKDHILEMASNFLVELGEIESTFNKSDQNAIKAYITSFKDRVRPPYAKDAIDKKRRVSLCGTANSDNFLRDVTGDRRFVVIPIQSIDRDEINIDLVWAYFYHIYIENQKNKIVNSNFDEMELKELYHHNRNFRYKNSIQLQLEQYFDFDVTPNTPETPFTGSWYTSKDILDVLTKKQHQNEEKLSPVKLGRELTKMSNVHSKIKDGRTLYFAKEITFD